MNARVDFPQLAPDMLSDMKAVLRARPFRPHRWIPGGHLQTLVAPNMRRNFSWGWTSCEEGLVELSDGARLRTVTVLQESPAPTLVALHGMGGSSDSTYMQALSHKAHREGWNAILVNLYDTHYRGRKPTIFHSGASRPLADLLNVLIRRHGLRQVFVVGVSMSGNILLKLLGELPLQIPEEIHAAAVLSPLVDMTISWQILERPSNRLYRFHFVKGLKRIMRRRAPFVAPYVDLNSLMKVRTIREFDEAFTAPLGGFRDAFDYYRCGSAAPLAGGIRLPTLIIHAQDDPLLPWEPFTRPEFAANPNLLVHLTKRGGHVAFVEQERIDIDRSWAENRVIDFFRLAARR